MNFHVLTLFPDMVKDGLYTSILKRAMDNGLISLNTVNIRDYTLDKHKKTDDYPFGGGAGLLMQADPVFRAYEAVTEGKQIRTIYLSPQGHTFNQRMAEELSKEENLVFLCGHYEGIDARIYPEVDLEVSLGDYILTGGELAACVMIDAITRLQRGTFKKEDVTSLESFEGHLLEAPQYTRPEVWRGRKVPAVLLNGNHKEIEAWKHEQALQITKQLRPDLLETASQKSKKVQKKKTIRRK